MEQKEYIEKYMALEQQMADLKKSYIESNSPWPVGTKVVVHHRQYGNFPAGDDEYGIVKGYEIAVTDEVRPILAKIKKDGTAHPTAIVYVSCNADVELCNE
jgi:hypothetical protein